MSLFIDVISNDEMFSDSFPIKVVDDIVYEVNCVLIQVTGDTEIGTEQEEALEDNIRIVNNLVHTFRLQPTTFDKKSYLMHLKNYVQSIKRHLKDTNPDRVHAFEQGFSQYAKKNRRQFQNI